MTIALIAPPAHEPLSLAEIKAHLRVDHDHEDSFLIETLKAARQYTEFASGVKLISQEWRQYENKRPHDGCIPLKLRPVQSINTVTAYDVEGNSTVLQTAQYQLTRTSDQPVLEISTSLDGYLLENGLEIDMVVGLGDFGVDTPESLKRAIMLLIAHWYEFRGAVSPSQQPVSLPPGFENLIMPHRRLNL